MFLRTRVIRGCENINFASNWKGSISWMVIYRRIGNDFYQRTECWNRNRPGRFHGAREETRQITVIRRVPAEQFHSALLPGNFTVVK